MAAEIKSCVFSSVEIPLRGLDTVGQQLQVMSSNIHPVFEHKQFHALCCKCQNAVILRSDDLFLPDVFQHFKSLTT